MATRPKPEIGRKKKTPEQIAAQKAALALFGESLTLLMDQRELGIEALAMIIDQHYDSVVKYRAGKRDPELAILIKIADLFDVPLDRLVGRKRDGSPRLRVV